MVFKYNIWMQIIIKLLKWKMYYPIRQLLITEIVRLCYFAVYFNSCIAATLFNIICSLYIRSINQIMPQCAHKDQIQAVTPRGKGCEECLKTGDEWVALRLCLSCGHVGCCDSSKNTHATKHYQETKHPIIKSNEPGEDWLWCYVDEVML